LEKCQEILNFSFSDLFRNGKISGLGPHFVDHNLRLVHGGPARRHKWETARERSGSAPACRCSPTAAGKGEGSVGDSPRGSPELGERWSGQATRVKWRQWWGSVGACSTVGEEERRVVSGAGCSGVEVPFDRGWGRAPGDDNGGH
jgi:hypothetical protein